MNPRDGEAYRVGSRSYRLPRVKGVSGEQVYGMAETRVKRLLAFQMCGKYGLDDIASVLVAASSRRVSINQACKDMVQAPDESTVRHHLSKLSMDLLQSRVNHVLIEKDLSILPKKPLKVALDITPIPYHGTDEGWWVRRGRAKHGTTRFFCYVMAYVMLHGRRITHTYTHIVVSSNTQAMSHQILSVHIKHSSLNKPIVETISK